MTEKASFLKGKQILAVDDEEDVLETILEIWMNPTWILPATTHPLRPK